MAQTFYSDVKGRLPRYHRQQNDLAIMPGLSVTVAETRKEAHARVDELQELIHPDHGLAYLSRRIGHDVTDRQQRLLEKAGLPVAMPDLDHDALIAVMRNDKKAEHGKMRFVLPTKLGHVELVGDVDEQDVRNAMQPTA